MRLLAMLIAGCGTALLALPLAVLGQGGPVANPGAEKSEAARKFRAYLDADWKAWMELYPEIATLVGYPGQNGRWMDDSQAGIERRKKHLAESIATLKGISRESLPTSEQLNYDLYTQLLETSEHGLQYGDDPLPFRFVVPHNLWMPINQMEGLQQESASTLANSPHHSVAEYEVVLQRLTALPAVVDQQVELLKAGLAKGYSPPKVALRDVPKQIADLIPADPIASALLQPFTEFPTGIGEPERKRLTDEATKIYRTSVAPAFQRLHDYYASTYLPACRETIAATSLPNGAAAYS